MPPTDRVAKLEAKLEKLRKVYKQHKHLDRIIRKNQETGFLHKVLFDLWLPIEEAVREGKDATKD